MTTRFAIIQEFPCLLIYPRPYPLIRHYTTAVTELLNMVIFTVSGTLFYRKFFKMQKIFKGYKRMVIIGLLLVSC